MKSKLLSLITALIGAAAFGQSKPAYTDAEAAQHIGEEATVTGKVFSVFTSSKGTTFLNFGASYPKHVFGGIIFAGNTATVGDLKQYEGKEVSLSGRIEAGPDKKPQIVIKGTDQIKLAGTPPPAPATPPPAPAPVAATPSPSSKPAPSATPPAMTRVVEESPAKRAGKIELSSGWSSTRRGGDMVRKDLARLFGSAGKPSETTDVDASMEIYPGVPFLSPLTNAKKALNLDGAASTKSKVATPGFPVDSFSAHAFSGVFPGGFNRILLVTDSDEQIVSVLLIDSASRTRVNNETDTDGYHTYNFVTGGAKATGNLVIKHTVTPSKTAANVFIVDTLLVDPTDPEFQPTGRSKGITRASTFIKQRTGKVLERSRWFIPGPVVNLILRCVGGTS